LASPLLALPEHPRLLIVSALQMAYLLDRRDRPCWLRICHTPCLSVCFYIARLLVPVRAPAHTAPYRPLTPRSPFPAASSAFYNSWVHLILGIP